MNHYLKFLPNDLKLCIILFACLLSACKHNLTREEAEQIIKSTFSIPNNEVRELVLKHESIYGGYGRLKKLEEQGLIKIREQSLWMGTNWYMELTEKANQYYPEDGLLGDDMNSVPIRVSYVDFGQITGILELEEQNIAEVEFTIVRSNITPFGEFMHVKEGPENKKVRFIKFDDGWRIELK
ncbi:MAG: hypothetical protein U0V54_09325 [Saprospiraceae bacterium]